MEIELVRWYNARLLQIFAGKATYASLARLLDKDIALVQKWFNKRQLTKAIGNEAARDIEQTLKHFIILESGQDVRTGWLDTPHHDLWMQYINVTLKDSGAKYYPTDSIYSTTVDILDRVKNNNLNLSSSDIAALIVQYLPLWSPNDKIKNEATDTVMTEALRILRETAKKRKKLETLPKINVTKKIQ